MSDAGLCSLVVSNAAGTVTSQAVAIKVAPKLLLQPVTQGLRLTWKGGFILQAAPSPAGPYADLVGATSPYLYSTRINAQQYFRLRQAGL